MTISAGRVLVDREVGHDRNAVAAAKRRARERDDPRPDQARARLLADQLAPQRAGRREHVDHPVERRAGGLRQRRDQRLDRDRAVPFIPRAPLHGTNGSFLTKIDLMPRPCPALIFARRPANGQRSPKRRRTTMTASTDGSPAAHPDERAGRPGGVRHDRRDQGGPEPRAVPVPRPQPLDQRRREPLDDPRLLRRRARGQLPHDGVRVHQWRAAGAARQQRGRQSGRVPAARARRLRHHDLRPARDRARASRSGSSRPSSRASSTCRGCSASTTRYRRATSRSASR